MMRIDHVSWFWIDRVQNHRELVARAVTLRGGLSIFGSCPRSDGLVAIVLRKAMNKRTAPAARSEITCDVIRVFRLGAEGSDAIKYQRW